MLTPSAGFEGSNKPSGAGNTTLQRSCWSKRRDWRVGAKCYTGHAASRFSQAWMPTLCRSPTPSSSVSEAHCVPGPRRGGHSRDKTSVTPRIWSATSMWRRTHTRCGTRRTSSTRLGCKTQWSGMVWPPRVDIRRPSHHGQKGYTLVSCRHAEVAHPGFPTDHAATLLAAY